jgi:hypothetical protein
MAAWISARRLTGAYEASIARRWRAARRASSSSSSRTACCELLGERRREERRVVAVDREGDTGVAQDADRMLVEGRDEPERDVRGGHTSSTIPSAAMRASRAGSGRWRCRDRCGPRPARRGRRRPPRGPPSRRRARRARCRARRPHGGGRTNSLAGTEPSTPVRPRATTGRPASRALVASSTDVRAASAPRSRGVSRIRPIAVPGSVANPSASADHRSAASQPRIAIVTAVKVGLAPAHPLLGLAGRERGSDRDEVRWGLHLRGAREERVDEVQEVAERGGVAEVGQALARARDSSSTSTSRGSRPRARARPAAVDAEMVPSRCTCSSTLGSVAMRSGVTPARPSGRGLARRAGGRMLGHAASTGPSRDAVRDPVAEGG